MAEWGQGEIRHWVYSQRGENRWYQTIRITEQIVTPGTVDTIARIRQMRLPTDLRGKTVLDVGCNSGALCLECKRRAASRVVGIDIQDNRLDQARTLAAIMGLDIDFRNMDLFRMGELGTFDIVFCVAVVTQITDLVGALLLLKSITRETLYLETATLETFPSSQFLRIANILNALGWPMYAALHQLLRQRRTAPLLGCARLRRIRSRRVDGWALVPDKRFLRALMCDDFIVADLGPSARYHLFRFERLRGTGAIRRSPGKDHKVVPKGVPSRRAEHGGNLDVG